jgi:hypothetical protein
MSHLFHACYMPRPSHPPWVDHPNNIWWRAQVLKLLMMQSSPASLLGPNNLLSALLSDTLSLWINGANGGRFICSISDIFYEN